MTKPNSGALPVPAPHFRIPRQLLLLCLNLVLYAFLVRWVLHNINFSLFVEAFGRIPAWTILVSFLFNFFALILYGERMQLLLFRNFAVSFATVNIGYAYNTILPFRLGDVTKIYWCHRLFSLRISQIVAATIAEKLVDLCMLLVLGSSVCFLSANRSIQIGALLSLAAALVAGLAGLLLTRTFLVSIVRMLPKRGALRRGVIGLFRHSDRYQFGKIFVATLAIWGTNIILFYMAFNTYLPGVHISVLDAIALLVITALTIALPSAPAGIGLFETGIVVFLNQAHHIPFEPALAAATVFHVVVTIPQIIIAGLWVWYIKKRPRLVTQAYRTRPPPIR